MTDTRRTPRKTRRTPSNGQQANRSSQNRKSAQGWTSRRAAADILSRIMDDGADMEAALAASDLFEALEGADRGFARAIASAALRAIGRIDRALEGFIDRPLDKVDPAIMALLRCGCAQLWVLNAPSYAAVSATVEAARKWPPASRGGGMINAILRRADRERDAFDSLPITTVWPDWLATRMIAALGPEKADALARLQLEDPRIDLTVKSDPAHWAKVLEGEALPTGSVRLPHGAPVPMLEGYGDGAWWVQDAGAALAARLLGDVSGQRVADLCAAPGGKTMQLAHAGADVTALDLSATRIARVTENLERTQLKANTIVGDARDWRPETPFDAVLLDAPCSALGTLRRHPEGAWRRTPKGLDRYGNVQTALLNGAHAMLKPGGLLVYCVCTPLPAEGVDVIEAALAQGGWKLSPIAADEIPGFAHGLTDKGMLLTAPPPAPPTGSPEDELFVTSDVFFVARLQKA